MGCRVAEEGLSMWASFSILWVLPQTHEIGCWVQSWFGSSSAAGHVRVGDYVYQFETINGNPTFTSRFKGTVNGSCAAVCMPGHDLWL